jgi:hypothetical protein
MAKLSKKKKDALINAAFSAICAGIQIPMMKMPAIWKIGERIFDETGGDLAATGAALKEACLQVAVKGV